MASNLQPSRVMKTTKQMLLLECRLARLLARLTVAARSVPMLARLMSLELEEMLHLTRKRQLKLHTLAILPKQMRRATHKEGTSKIRQLFSRLPPPCIPVKSQHQPWVATKLRLRVILRPRLEVCQE
jgi:hypothetical protein